MRHAAIVSLALATALLLPGCGASPSDANSRIPNAQEKIKDAASATTEAARAEWDKFTREATRQLSDFDDKCKQLEMQITTAQGQVKKDLEKKLEEAKVKRDVAANKLTELKEGGVERWEKIKEGLGKALEDLKKAFE
jgi:DnaJ-domain-containing protein 1